MAARLVSANGWPFEVALVAAVIGTTLVGVVVALPAIRTRGTSLAVATLAIALMFNALIFTNSSVTGGVVGLPIKRVSFAGIDLDPLGHPQRYGAFVLVVLVLVAVLVANLRRGRAGARLLAVRSNERAAASLGINVIAAKMYAFAVAAAIAALGGVLLSMRQTNVRVHAVQRVRLGAADPVRGRRRHRVGLGHRQRDRRAHRARQRHLPEDRPVGHRHRVVARRAVGSRRDPRCCGRRPTASRRCTRAGSAGPRNGRPRCTASSRGCASRARSPTRPPARARAAPRRAVTLAVSDLVVKFGGVVAVDGVSFAIEPGEVVGLIGPNGAGKTTILDVVTGFTTPSSGSVRFGDATIDRWSVERRARAGIVRSWQAVELFEEMTVRENLLVASDDQSRAALLHRSVPARAPGTRPRSCTRSSRSCSSAMCSTCGRHRCRTVSRASSASPARS